MAAAEIKPKTVGEIQHKNSSDMPQKSMFCAAGIT
jgi:hypothetical protein